MVFDATEKYPEELSDPVVTSKFNLPQATELSCDKELIMSRFPEISGINQDLPAQGIHIVIFAIAKQRPGHLREIAARCLRERMIIGSGFLLFMDEMVNISDLAQVVWLAANNLDPSRDCFYPQNEDGTDFPVLCLDGTSKSGTYDNFSREWPNVILMDEQTIHSIDEKWAHLNLGKFIPSPSLYHHALVKNSGAVASRG
jgi:4-hydroxy-3-polyprenylbenzoate decarboxylase